ncbi:hypothetical protein EON67_03175, partial [archaeon]
MQGVRALLLLLRRARGERHARAAIFYCLLSVPPPCGGGTPLYPRAHPGGTDCTPAPCPLRATHALRARACARGGAHIR